MAEWLGDGEWTFEVEENWAKVPDEIALGDCAAVGVDSKDNVYAFNRGEHPIAVFDNDGNLLRTWGEGMFTQPHCEPHGVHVAPDDTIWLTDDGDHTVRHCTLDGRVLMTLGIPGKPSPFMSGEPFHHCTHTALSPECDHLYISDGYSNARIHKYTVDGKLLKSWGEPGTDPGQFNIPHNICCDPEGWIYVADRENHRVQVFDANGKWETQWNYLHRPNGMCLGRGLGAAWQDTRRHPAGAVHYAARHRRRLPRQHICRRIVGEVLVALLARPGAGEAPRHPPPAQDHCGAASIDGTPELCDQGRRRVAVRRGAAPDGRGQAVQEGGERDGRGRRC